MSTLTYNYIFKCVWLFESKTSEDYRAQVIWCFLAVIAQEQREHPSKRLLCALQKRESHRVWKDSKWWQILDVCVCGRWKLHPTHALWALAHIHHSFFLLFLSVLSTQHPHSVILRQLGDTFDAWFTTVFQTDRLHTQNQRKQHHKTPHARRPVSKTDTRDTLSALALHTMH